MSGGAERVARVREVFDDWAERGRAEGMEAGHGFAARAAFDELEVAPGKRYLDLGCGNGYTVRWGAEVVGPEGRAAGLDLSSAMVERARAASEGLANVEFHQAAFPDNPFDAESFDAIFTMEVLYYLPDLSVALAEIHRLLAPGGRIACVVDYYVENDESHSWPEEVGCEMTLLSSAGWQAAFAEAGLEVLSQGRLLYPLAEGEEETWKHTVGSLFTLARRP